MATLSDAKNGHETDFIDQTLAKLWTIFIVSAPTFFKKLSYCNISKAADQAAFYAANVNPLVNKVSMKEIQTYSNEFNQPKNNLANDFRETWVKCRYLCMTR